jgi:hypothetical protein
VLRRTLQTTRGRLAVLVATVAFVMFSTAALLHFAFDQFDTYGDALWSAAVHLVDPGSLIEDDGAAERAMGMFQAIAGLVLLIGLLFELISETVGRSIERLGRYDPPVHASGHLLIIGGGELLTEAAGALALANEVGEGRERVVVLAPESSRQSRRRMLEELREQAGPAKLDLVFGDVADESGFELGAAARASTVLVLPSSSGPVIAEAADVEVMRTGLALEEYLAERGAEPDVRLLFRRGRNVDAVWEMLPDGWDAIVGDRTVASVLRHAMTGFGGLTELGELLDTRKTGNRELLPRARERAESEGRPLRLTIVGCGIDTPALLEDLAEAGAERFEVIMLAARKPFETYLGRTDRAGVALRFDETPPDDPERLREALARANPDVALVTPSPLTWDLRNSDAEATLALLHVLQALGPETPLLAELFLPESVERLPADPRLLPVSVLESVSAAMALTIFNPERARQLGEALESEANGRR